LICLSIIFLAFPITFCVSISLFNSSAGSCPSDTA
jgi:hypothetical protein